MIYSQTYSIQGKLVTSGLTSDDIPHGSSSVQSSIGYIPTLSIKKNISDEILIDGEWAYHLERNYLGSSLYSRNEKNHRFWIRYSNEKLETRLGLQKIVFGPSQILRTLSWFDTFDLMDPAARTDGVKGFRLRWFPSNNLSIWSWTILNQNDTLSYGNRFELSGLMGEWGLTYHRDPTETMQSIGQIGIPIIGSHNRLAIDYRYDGIIGFWNESAIVRSNRSKVLIATVGADYTLPIANGILVMGEYMSISNKLDSDKRINSYWASMVRIPLGLVQDIMFISQYDIEQSRGYHYIRFSNTYDQFSLNLIMSLFPKRADYNIPEELFSKSLAGFGTGIQLMVIYNH